MNFVAIDFETANSQRFSPCAFAVAVFRDGEVTQKESWLIRPKELYFDPYNIFIHGITEDDVKNEPEWPELWDTFRSYLEADFVIAHNASFDMSVLRHTLEVYGIAFPEFHYSCTRIVAKKAWPGLVSYSLTTVADLLGITFQHHDPVEDALACGQIATAAFRTAGCQTFDDLATQLDMRNGRIFVGGYEPASSFSRRSGSSAIDVASIVAQNEEFDVEHPCYGRMFAFTGTLKSMTRREGMQEVLNVGGRCNNSVTKETNYLVVGDFDFRKFRGGTKSKKLQYAESLVEKGQDLEIIAEADFLQLLGS